MKKSVKRVAVVAIIAIGTVLGTAGKAEARQQEIGPCINGAADVWSFHSFLGIQWGTRYEGQISC